MAVPPRAAVRLLGDASVRIVPGEPRHGPVRRQRCQQAVEPGNRGLRGRPGAPRWASLPLTTLALRAEDEDDPTFPFGRAVAQFLLAMPSDRIKEATFQLIDVAGEAAPPVRYDVASGVLRIVGESAGLLGERVREGRIAPVTGLPSRLAALDRTGELRKQVWAANIALYHRGLCHSGGRR